MHAFLLPADFFSKLTNSFRNTIRVSNSLDPDQARQFVGPEIVGPDLGPNCLQRISADGTGGKELIMVGIV